MKPHYKILIAVLVALGIAAPPASAQDSQSAAAAATLTALLDQHKLEAISARDPDQPGRFVAALYFPGAQLLVVSAPYPVPAVLDKRIAEAKHMDVYVDIHSAKTHEGQFFVVDPQADGIRRVCEQDQQFDSTSRNGGAHVSFDGKWQAQGLSDADYNARFTEDDARYAGMLAVLANALRPATAPTVAAQKGGK
jgi:hypothetical protein